MEAKHVTEAAGRIAKKADVVRKKTRGRFLTSISAALALVVGLSWNDAISTFIKYLFPLDSNTIVAKFIYAVILTVIISFGIMYLESVLGDKED